MLLMAKGIKIIIFAASLSHLRRPEPVGPVSVRNMVRSTRLKLILVRTLLRGQHQPNLVSHGPGIPRLDGIRTWIIKLGAPNRIGFEISVVDQNQIRRRNVSTMYLVCTLMTPRHNYTSHSEGASGDKYKRTLIELRATVYSLIFGRVPLVHAELYSDSNRVLSFEWRTGEDGRGTRNASWSVGGHNNIIIRGSISACYCAITFTSLFLRVRGQKQRHTRQKLASHCIC